MATIRKRTLPSGKVVYQCDYRDGGGNRRHKQFPTKRAADDFLLIARGEVRAGVHTPDSQTITVAKAADNWLARARMENRETSTIASYEQHVDLYIKPLLGGRKLNEVTTPMVQEFADELTQTRSKKTGKILSRAMVKKVVGSLSSIYSEAQRLGKSATNPVKAVRIRLPKRDNGRPEMPTKEELRAILSATPDKHKPFIYTAAFTGLRGSELRGLQWRDLDLDAGILRVRRRADPYNELGAPKSEAGTRDVPLGPAVIKLLRGWRKDCPKGDLDLVFPNGAGKIESHANLLNRVFWPIQIAAGVVDMVDGKDEGGKPIKVAKAKYSLHALRHAAAAMWIDQGVKPKRIQVLMGHASIQQTFDVYGYLIEAKEDDQAAARAIEEALLV